VADIGPSAVSLWTGFVLPHGSEEGREWERLIDIESLDDLRALEEEIRLGLQKHNLESVLLGLRHYAEHMKAFVIAGTALFAVRHCTAGPHTPGSTA
jgi:hypothetical protein